MCYAGPKSDTASHDGLRGTSEQWACSCMDAMPVVLLHKAAFEARSAAPLQAQPHPAALQSQELSSLCRQREKRPCQATPLKWPRAAAWLAQSKWCQAIQAMM